MDPLRLRKGCHLLWRPTPLESASAEWSGIRYQPVQYGVEPAAFGSHPYVRLDVQQPAARPDEESGRFHAEAFFVGGAEISAAPIRVVQHYEPRDFFGPVTTEPDEFGIWFDQRSGE